MKNVFDDLAMKMEGDLFVDDVTKIQYSTDASAYKETPLAIARPKSANDLHVLIQFARDTNMFLIPRTAGTSLAGQVVGAGIIVDLSRYFTNIIDVNKDERWVKVQPGVILDEMNEFLKKDGLFFAPETSTSNRCMIGGMVGNNSCGAHSLIYGSTREHLLAVKAILGNGEEVEFTELSNEQFNVKCKEPTREGAIYAATNRILSDEHMQAEILDQYPDINVERRNTGYALDILLNTSPYKNGAPPFNMAKLIAGSEGTLAFVTEIKLNLIPLTTKEKGLICIHHKTLEESFNANIIALKYHPDAIELMDKFILDCTKSNIEQTKNRFFVEGDPGAILCIEISGNDREELKDKYESIVGEVKSAGYGYHYPVLFGEDIKKAWALRKAGLGLLSNLPGDGKPAPVIEDTAVNPELLPEYLKEFQDILDKHNLECVFYGHIATGELHLRPVLNLKDPKDVELFHTIALEVAHLVKKFNGSLSGEHGDGRLRGEFIPLMLGDKIYNAFKEIKNTWDPDGIFNRGKIVDTPKMNTSLRYKPGQETQNIPTIFRFDESAGILRMAEKCNGSGDCRKTELIGGTMCPSYMASRDENTTTRARANVLREFLTNSEKSNPFDHQEIYDVLDLCLSCKGCKSECPSNVDMAKLKAEFLQHYYDSNGVPLRSWMIAHISKFNRLGAVLPWTYNFVMKNNVLSGVIKRTIGFAKDRSMPLLGKQTFRKWIRKNATELNGRMNGQQKEVYVFVDEFTNYNDTDIGKMAMLLLHRLGYKIHVIDHDESGRTYISKGFLRKAKKIANKNVKIFKGLVTDQKPVVGIEPSAILTFRDEYPDLVDDELLDEAKMIAKNALTLEEFISREIKNGSISQEKFTDKELYIKIHGHCQQKAVSSVSFTKEILSFPVNYHVEEIESGCCGMAGSFGYEKEHYDLSMKVGELVLFPAVRAANAETVIVAAGTSCRHQIKDGTKRESKHPAEILFEALK